MIVLQQKKKTISIGQWDKTPINLLIFMQLECIDKREGKADFLPVQGKKYFQKVLKSNTWENLCSISFGYMGRMQML